ncbi:MAG: DUF2085 domain-containing protein [bacterium]
MNKTHYIIILSIVVLFNAAIFAITVYDNSLTAYGHFAFSIICHQKEDRTFQINGQQMPVCHRCLGIYLGALLGVVGFLFYRNMKLSYFLISMLPMALDGGTQLVGLRESNSIIRLATGGIAGTACALFIIPSMFQLMNDYEKFLKKKYNIIFKRLRS